MAAPSGKEVQTVVKVQAPAGQASPGSSLGPALGQHGVAIQDFCKQFNDATKDQEAGMTLPVVISVYKDRSFSFIVKTPPAAVLLRKAAKIDKGSGEPNKNKVGKVNRKQLEEIAEIKMKDLNAGSMDAAVKIIAGSARSMGIEVEL